MCSPACPHGPIILLPLFFAAAGTMYTLFSTFDCDFIRLNVTEYETVKGSSFGMWTVQNYHDNAIQPGDYNDDLFPVTNNLFFWGKRAECVFWNRMEKDDPLLLNRDDGKLRMARICSMCASVLGILILLWLLLGAYQRLSNNSISIITLLMIAVCIFTSLGLLMLQSELCDEDLGCELAFTGVICITAACFWCCAAGTTFCCLRSRENRESRKKRKQKKQDILLEEEEVVEQGYGEFDENQSLKSAQRPFSSILGPTPEDQQNRAYDDQADTGSLTSAQRPFADILGPTPEEMEHDQQNRAFDDGPDGTFPATRSADAFSDEDQPPYDVDAQGRPFFYDKMGRPYYYDDRGHAQYYEQPHEEAHDHQQPHYDDHGQPYATGPEQPYVDPGQQQPYFDEHGQPYYPEGQEQQQQFEQGQHEQQPYYDDQAQQPYYDEQGQPYYPENQGQQHYYANQGPQQGDEHHASFRDID